MTIQRGVFRIVYMALVFAWPSLIGFPAMAQATAIGKQCDLAVFGEGFLEAPHDDKVRDSAGDGEDVEANDELFEDAVRLVLEFGKASTSLLQRRMRIGYGRAAHLIDLMERDGIVGPADGSRPREILKPAGWLQEVEPSMR